MTGLLQDFIFRPSVPRLVWAMAYKGEWRPALQHVAEALAEQTRIRDYLDGEKVVQSFLAAHFSVVGRFVIHTGRELNKGYAYLCLEPFVAQYPDIGYRYVVEVKYRNGQNHEVPLVEAVRIGQGWPGSPKAADFNAFMNAGLPT